MINIDPVKGEGVTIVKNNFVGRDKMLNFSAITVDVLEVFRSYFLAARMPICDYTIGGTFLWVDYSDYEYAIDGETLYIRERLPSGGWGYWPAVGAADLVISACRLQDHCAACGEKLRLYPVQQSQIDSLSERFVIDKLENFEGRGDYIHAIEPFANFSGRRYAKKRNHLRNFQRLHPDYTLCELTTDRIEELLSFSESLIGGDSDESVDIIKLREYESGEVVKALRCYTLYGYEGLILYSEGVVCGYCFGEVVGDTLFVHAEKCLKSEVGCHQLIASGFARHMIANYPELKWINREDDMNVPGIRRAKESYHPDYIINKYIVDLGEVL